MKMLKSIFALVIAASLCCVSVFAANVKSTSGVVNVQADVDVTIKETSVTLTVEEVSDILADVDLFEGDSEDAQDTVTILWVKDIHVAPEDLPATLEFSVPGCEGLEVYVLHFNGTKWELVGTGIGPNVEATFTSLSPVALVVKNDEADADDAESSEVSSEDSSADSSADSSSTGKKKSPKTGENNFMQIGLCVAVMTACAAMVVMKKRS